LTRPSLAAPTAAVTAALTLLPVAPGVYRMRDGAGRVIYTGRSGDLRARVRSYWRDLGDRPHLARMLRSVAWVEPTLCASEHEAALFERHLLRRRRPPYNRTTGVEQLMHLRLVSDAAAPSLDPVVLDAGEEPGGELYGPYLGWEPVRQAAAALNRLYPLRYTADHLDPSRRELARSRGVGAGDRQPLANRIRAVLERRPRALAAARARLTLLRDQAAADLQFEAAAELQRQVDALGWIAQARPGDVRRRDGRPPGPGRHAPRLPGRPARLTARDARAGAARRRAPRLERRPLAGDGGGERGAGGAADRGRRPPGQSGGRARDGSFT